MDNKKINPQAQYLQYAGGSHEELVKPMVANKSEGGQRSAQAVTRSANKYQPEQHKEIGNRSVGEHGGSNEQLSGSAAAASGYGGRSQNSMASLEPTALKRNQLIQRMQARQKFNDQGKAFSQHTFNTVDGSIVESASAAEAEAMTSAIAVAKAAAAQQTSNQGEAAQRQEFAIRTEDEAGADHPGQTAPRHPDHLYYQQLQDMLDEFMTVRCVGHHDNSTTIINNSIYKNNMIIKSRAMNLLHATSKAKEVKDGAIVVRDGFKSPRNSKPQISVNLTADGAGESRQSQQFTIGGQSRWSMPGSSHPRSSQTGIDARGGGGEGRGGPEGGRGASKIKQKQQSQTPMPEDKAAKAASNDACVPRVGTIRVKSAMRQKAFDAEGPDDVLGHSPSPTPLNPADGADEERFDKASKPPKDDRTESIFPDTYADAHTLQCQLFSTASELYDPGPSPQTLEQLIQLNDKQTPMTRSQKTIVEILKYPHLRTEKNIKLMQEHFLDFDFMKKDASQKKNHQLAHAQSEVSDKRDGSEPMIKDQNTLNQMLRVMKLLVIPANFMVFDYMSQGDQFYMVVHGQVDCKVPFENQYVLMSKFERSLFVQEFKDDIVKIKEATSINKQISSLPHGVQKANQALMYDQLKQQMLKNPYEVSQAELIKHIDNLIYVEKSKIILEHRRNAESKATDSVGEIDEQEQGGQNGIFTSITTSKRPSINSPTAAKAPSNHNQSQSLEDGEQPRPILRGKAITDEEALLLREDVRLQRLLLACDTLLQNHKNQNERKFYQLSILKPVKTYGPCTSFGELALLTNKRRKAKLEVKAGCDAYFAVLNKKDYKNAIYKVQNQILQQKMEMLRSVALFSTLSNAQLNLISYGMQFRACSRGQVIYKEGDPRPDTVYLIKHGEFQCLKKVLKPECEHQKKLEELPISQDQEHGPKEEQERKVLLMRRTEILQNYNQTYQKSKTEEHEICIHSDSDEYLSVFGYQELLQEGTRTRSHSVVCLSAEGVLIEIHKSHLENMMRKVSKNLEPMIAKFEELVQIRVQNKIVTSCEYKKELLRQQRKEKSKSGYWDKRGSQQLSSSQKSFLRNKNSAADTPVQTSKMAHIGQQTPQPSPQKSSKKPNDDAPLQTHQSTKLVSSTTGIIERARVNLMEQANRAPGKFVRKDHEFEQIPAAQQSYVDKNFSYFKNSLHSSVTIPELKTIKKFEQKLEQKIHGSKVCPESAAQSKDKLLLSLIQKRVRLKQHLYVPPRSSSPKAIQLPMLANADAKGIVHQSVQLKTFHVDRGEVDEKRESSSYHYNPESSVFQGNRAFETSDKLDGQFQNKMLSDIQVLNNNTNDFQKKTHSVGNLYEGQSDWGKELSIVESKCFKFLSSQSNLDLDDADDRRHHTRSHLDQRQTSAATLSLLNESEFYIPPRSLYTKQYSKIQQSIQKSISHSDYDFAKDIEQLKETKQQQYLGALTHAPDFDAARKRYRSSMNQKNSMKDKTMKLRSSKDAHDIDEEYMRNPIIKMQIKNQAHNRQRAASSIDIVNQEPKRRSKVNVYRGYEARARKASTRQRQSGRGKVEEKTMEPEVVREVGTAEIQIELQPQRLADSVFDKEKAPKSLMIQRIRPKVNYRQLIFDHEQFNKQTLSQEEFLRKSHNTNLEHKLAGGHGIEAAAQGPYGIDMAQKPEDYRPLGARPYLNAAPAQDAQPRITKNQRLSMLRPSASQLSRLSGSSKNSQQKQPKPHLHSSLYTYNPKLISTSAAITLEQSLEEDATPIQHEATPPAQRNSLNPTGGFDSSILVSVQSNKKKGDDVKWEHGETVLQ